MNKNTTSLPDIKRTGILITLLAAAFLTSMSTAVTGNMIPNFTAYFGISSDLAQWLSGGAALISGVTLPITAFLIKRIPNRIYFLSAMSAFSAGSLAAFLSTDFPILLASRLLQAFGCGMLLSFGQIILLRLYPKEKHGFVMSAYSMSSLVSSVAGPTFAGLIMEHSGWRGVFLSLFVLGIIVIISGVIFMKNVTDTVHAKVSLLYAALSAAGFTALLIGISGLSGGSPYSKSIMLIFTGILLLIVFVNLQLRSEDPMLELSVFREPRFIFAAVLNLCMYLIVMGNAMILPIFAKTIRGFSDTAYGLATLAGSVLSVAATILAGRSYDKKGIKPSLIAGTVFFALFSAAGMFFTQNASILYVAFVFALQSVALSLLNSPVTALALSGFEGRKRVDGSAIYNTLRQISSSLATTLSVLIYTLGGSNIAAIRGVYLYFGIITAFIAAAVLLYIIQDKKS